MAASPKAVRHRASSSRSRPPEDIVYSSQLSSKAKRPHNELLAPMYMFGVLAALFLLTYGLVMFVEQRLPEPLLMQDEHKHPGRFIAERAYIHLVNLTSLGPRPVGSFENEVLTVNFLRKEINSIIQRTDPKVHQIRLDTQTVSGSFPLTFLDAMTNVYRNVQNVIVRIGPVVESGHSLLVNCHHDTQPDAPGASDDGSSCVLMLEVLRVISQSPAPLLNNIVFLFNGAEEAFLQASHGFITQHPWASKVRAFVNLEACGAGGREVLFQSGPDAPWLMGAYSQSVPYPFASSLAQDVFQSGLIPGDTDFRIFRDFGNIPGLDFAWNKNGYVYHTRLDDADQVPPASLQRTGDNILPLLLTLVNSPHLIAVHSHSQGSLIYFDFVGLFIVTMSSTTTILLCLATLVAVLSAVRINALSTQPSLKSPYWKLLLRCAGFLLVNYLSCLIVNLVIAFVLTKVNRAMSWYGAHRWLLFLYVLPVLITSCSNLLYFSHRHLVADLLNRRHHGGNNFVYYKLLTDSTMLVYAGIMMALMFTYVGSVMVPLVWLLSLSVFSILAEKSRLRAADSTTRLFTFFLFASVPFLLCSYLIYCVYLLIIPIMGRSGSGNHAEEVIAFITATIFALLFNFLAPLVLYVRSPKKILSLLSTVFLVAVLSLLFTPIGFPYSGDPRSPTPQRHMVMHVDRVYFARDQTVRAAQSGLWLIDLDVNSPKTIEHFLDGPLTLMDETSDCGRELYCGLPYYLPVYSFIFRTHWIADKVYTPLGVPLDLKLTFKDVVWSARRDNESFADETITERSTADGKPSDRADTRKHERLGALNRTLGNGRVGTRIKLSFALNGTDHVNIILSPYAGVELVSWSLHPGPPLKSRSRSRGRDVYFTFYTCASNLQTFHFWVEFFVDVDTAFDSSETGQYDGDIVDVAIAAHHVHGEKQLTKRLEAFFQKFPPWTVTTGWRAGVQLYTF